MKTLSIEEKAKAYDKAFGRAKALYAKGAPDSLHLEEMFPALKESEDERIRNFISNELACLRATEGKGSDRYEELTNAIAWLEKQGEQKPTDNVEPKFKVGEWITNGEYTWKIVDVKPLDYILQSQDGNIVDDTISHVDEQFHSFTIEDAKDGDVVVDKSDGTIGIFQSIGHHPDGGSYNDPSYCFLHCRYDDGYFYADFENGNTMDSDDAIPATKEQCDTLFAKMKDAGYIFDFKKKELKEIEQKPTWSEKDDYYRDHLITWLNCRAIRVDIRKDFIDWLKSLKKRMEEQK